MYICHTANKNNNNNNKRNTCIYIYVTQQTCLLCDSADVSIVSRR